MHSIRKSLIVRFICLTLVLAIFGISCSSDRYSVVNNSDGLQKRASNFSAEEIYKGIFFGLGDFVNEINGLKKNNFIVSSVSEDILTEYIEGVDVIMDQLKEQNNLVFANFKNDLKSGDPTVVASSIESQLFNIKTVIDDSYDGDLNYDENAMNTELANLETAVEENNSNLAEQSMSNIVEMTFGGVDGTGVNDDVCIVKVFVLWVAVVYQIAVAIEIFVFFANYFAFGMVDNTGENLEYQIMIGDLAAYDYQ